MAAPDAPRGKPATAQQAEPAHGLEGVLGARGMEPAAGAEKGAHRPLVAADQADDEEAKGAAHVDPRLLLGPCLGLAPSEPSGADALDVADRSGRAAGAGSARGAKSLPPVLCSITFVHSAVRLACSSAPGAPRAFGRALTTRSTAGRVCWCSRNDSRMMRRMRLRSTALPAVRTATAMPRRAPCLSLLLAVTAKNPSPKRRPRAYAASNSDLRRRRLCAGKVSRCISSPRPTHSASGAVPMAVRDDRAAGSPQSDES